MEAIYGVKQNDALVEAPTERRSILSVADSNLEIAYETICRVNAIVRCLTGVDQEKVDIEKPDSFDALMNETNRILNQTIDKVVAITQIIGI